MCTDADRPIVARGALRTIEYAVCLNGSVPARDFIEELPQAELSRLAALFQRLADTGKIADPRKFKKLEGKLYEFKRYQVRTGCFRIENRWILTHGFIKQKDKWPRRELERAERIMREHLQREEEQEEETCR